MYSIFSRVSSLLNLLCKRTLELIYENVSSEGGLPDLLYLLNSKLATNSSVQIPFWDLADFLIEIV